MVVAVLVSIRVGPGLRVVRVVVVVETVGHLEQVPLVRDLVVVQPVWVAVREVAEPVLVVQMLLGPLAELAELDGHQQSQVPALVMVVAVVVVPAVVVQVVRVDQVVAVRVDQVRVEMVVLVRPILVAVVVVRQVTAVVVQVALGLAVPVL